MSLDRRFGIRYSYYRQDMYGGSSGQGQYDFVTTDIKNGYAQPRFLTLIRERRSATTSRYASRMTISRIRLGEVFVSWVVPFSNPKASGGFTGVPGLPTSFSLPGMLTDGTAVQGASTEFYARCRSLASSGAEIATDALELKKTLAGLKQPFREILTVARRRGRGEIPGLPIKQQLRLLAGGWLEIQFGIKPIIMSVSGTLLAAKMVADRTWSTTVYTTKKDVSVRTVSASSWQPVGAVDGMLSFRVNRVTEQEKSTRSRGTLVFRPLSTSQQFGYDSTSWVRAAWEVIPYSFLVDYLVGVGDWIDALCYKTSELSCLSQSTKRRWKQSVTVDFRSSGSPNYRGHAVIEPFGFTVTRELINRTTALAPIGIPAIKVTNSTTALINSVALLLTRLNRR